MLKIGLTGGIGTGKSIVARLFRQLGIPVYVSDIEAKRLMIEDPEIRSGLTEKFGTEVYLPDLSLNRVYLADLIFNHPQNLAMVNSIVHPIVRKDFERWSKRQNSPYVIQESAILFDTGLYKNFDKIICVTADEEIRVKRVMMRDGVSEEAVRQRMRNQMAEADKMAKSDFVIYNNQELLIPQIEEIDRKLRQIL